MIDIYMINYIYYMQRGPGILIGGGIRVVIGVILVVISINSLSSLSISMPTDISTKSNPINSQF